MLNVQIHKVTGSLLEAQKSVPNLVKPLRMVKITENRPGFIFILANFIHQRNDKHSAISTERHELNEVNSVIYPL